MAVADVPPTVPAAATAAVAICKVVPVAFEAIGADRSSRSTRPLMPVGGLKLEADRKAIDETTMVLADSVVMALVAWVRLDALMRALHTVPPPSMGLWVAVSMPEKCRMPPTTVPPSLAGLAKVQV